MCRPVSARHLEGTRLESLRSSEEIARRLAGVEESMRRLEDRSLTLEARSWHIRQLGARAYEAQQRWPERLAEIRASADYEHAFEGEPLVSVRIATYNRAEKLCERALASVRRQSYERWEAVVVGDACDDDTAERVASIGDSRIRFRNLPFRGPYPDDPRASWMVRGVPPFNAAEKDARGAWIAPLDDDNEWDDDHIEVLLRCAQERRAELAYGRMRVAIEGSDLHGEFGVWPPTYGEFDFQSGIFHARLRDLSYDPNAFLADEVSDWNRARRMWEAGVRFEFLDRPVGTYCVARDHLLRDEWLSKVAARSAQDGDGAAADRG
jgi:glycosyltransferase involved in cell wall biosynthesis